LKISFKLLIVIVFYRLYQSKFSRRAHGCLGGAFGKRFFFESDRAI
jgi:hypothetical protein